jgi:hypothetical protein
MNQSWLQAKTLSSPERVILSVHIRNQLSGETMKQLLMLIMDGRKIRTMEKLLPASVCMKFTKAQEYQTFQSLPTS